MANIALVTGYYTNDEYANNTSAVLVSLGNNVEVYDGDQVNAAVLQNYDLIVAVGYDWGSTTSDSSIEAYNNGTPLLVGAGRYTNLDRLIPLKLGHTDYASMRTRSFTIEPVENEYNLFDDTYGQTINMSGRYNSLILHASTKEICEIYALHGTNEIGYVILEDSKSYGFAGFISNLDVYEPSVLKVLDDLIKLLSGESNLEISGVTTLDGNPVSQTVIAITNDINDMKVIGTAQSDPTTGDYSIVTTYNKPVMVFTMQDYGEPWQAGLTLSGGDTVHPTTDNGYFYRVTEAGTTGTTEPTWPTEAGTSVVDGGVTYTTELLLKPEIAGYKTPTPIN